MLRLLVLLLPLLLAFPADAVLINSGDGTGNIGGPIPDPGWNHIGLRGALTAVYLGNGYVITAAHVGFGDVVLNGVPHTAVPGTDVVVQNPDGSPVDLRLFAIHPIPALPSLPISLTTPNLGDDLILAGNGRDRGAETSFDPNGPPPPGPIGGYLWGPGQTLRWGTNQMAGIGTVDLLNRISEAFFADFDAGATPHEGIATTGDSGGAVFVDNGGQWQLAGIMIATSAFAGQPLSSSVYGNTTHMVDLAFYRDDILAVVALPEPSGGLLWGALALLGLSHLRRHR